MNTLIVYATKYGSTKKCVDNLSERLNGEVVVYNIKETKPTDLTQYDRVIIGGSIYIGKIQKEIHEFCTNNLDTLKQKTIGLFICCMRERDQAEAEIRDSFPEELVKRALAKDYFGGEFIFSKMNFFERLIVKKVAKIDSDTSNILDDRIEEFAKIMNGL